MPLEDDDLREVQRRVMEMFMDTIATFQWIEQHADAMYGDRSADVRTAINEYLNDFCTIQRHPGSPILKH